MENPSEETLSETAENSTSATEAEAEVTTARNGQEPSLATGETSKDGENYNPDKMPDELKEVFLVDAIGDTLYSKRFVLKTLLNLNKVEAKLSEEFEKDLCTLWDMTIEKDVIRLLLENNVLDIFSGIVQMSEDQRLVEILVGIIGNMCSVADTRDSLCQQPDIMIPIIDLISCSDSLILVQLMRLFHTCLVFENSGDEYIWFQHFRCADQFVDKFAFILTNSMSTSLLVAAYEALNAICTKFAIIEIQPEILDSGGFRDIFVRPVLVHGVIEAFKQMLPETQRPLDASTDGENSQSNCSQIEDDILAPTKRTQRITNLFLDINVILSQYDAVSRQCYAPFMDEVMKCVTKCLKPLCNPIYLLPLTSNEQIVIENINELIQALDDPFDEQCFHQMITIWSLIDRHLARKTSPSNEWDAPEGDDEDVSGFDINMTILEYLTRTSKNATTEQIVAGLNGISRDVVNAIYRALSAGEGEDDIKDCCDKIKEAAKITWNVELTVSEISDLSDVDDEENGKDEQDENGERNEIETDDDSNS